MYTCYLTFRTYIKHRLQYTDFHSNLFQVCSTTSDPMSMYLIRYTNSYGSGETVHMRSLTRAFAVCLHKLRKKIKKNNWPHLIAVSCTAKMEKTKMLVLT